jgi:hypothetical protein
VTVERLLPDSRQRGAGAEAEAPAPKQLPPRAAA